MAAQDPTTGCRGCASGVGQPGNIFGCKYGQNLAAVQVAREARILLEEQKEEARANAAAAAGGDGDSETDDDSDDDDYGPTPAAGVWAGGSKLELESEKLANGDDAEHVDDDADQHQAKKLKTSS